ncbi:MAG: hypothetical protein AB7S50_03210 [Bacteroidales bacterium]
MYRSGYLNLKNGIVLIIITILFTGCMHDEFELNKLITDVELEGGFFAPVGYGTLTVHDLIEDLDSTSYLYTDNDGLLYFSFTDSLYSYGSEEILTVPDQDFFEYFIEADFLFPPLWDTVPLDRSEFFPFSFANEEKLDSIYLDAGDMIFNISSDFKHTGLIIITCPSIRKNGVAFTQNINIDDPSGTFSTNNTFPLNGYVIELKDSIGSDSLFLPVDFHVELYNEGNPVLPTDQIEIIATIQNLDFDAIFGYIGDYEIMGQTDSIEFDVFDNELFVGGVQFANPQINFNIRNSFGVPVEANITRFTAFTSDGDSLALTLDTLINPFQFAFPTLSEYGQVKDSVWSLDATNTNISDLLAILPTSFIYNVEASSNPDGPSVPYNFVSDESYVDIEFEFVLPVWFKTNDFALQDTVELDLSGIAEDADMIEQANVLLAVSNGLPIDINMQVYFADSLYVPVDTMFRLNQQPLIKSGILDANNIVQTPGTKTVLVQYTGEQITNLENVRFAIIKAGLITPQYDENVYVKFFDYYKIDYKISADIDFRINTQDL